MLNYIDKDNYNSIKDFLIAKTNIDLNDYCEIFIKRQIGHFFKIHNIADVSSFINRISNYPEYINNLLGNTSVEESDIFRDPTMWNILINELIPEILKTKEKFRILLPDFTTGEELISLLILLKEYNYSLNAEIIIGTKVNSYIADFKKLTYSSKKFGLAKDNSRHILNIRDFETYYKENGKFIRFNPSVLEKIDIKFLEINLRADKIPENIDLILFRNKLLYYKFNVVTDIVNKLLKSLNRKGFIITGVKDMVLNNKELNFISKEERIYWFNG